MFIFHHSYTEAYNIKNHIILIFDARLTLQINIIINVAKFYIKKLKIAFVSRFSHALDNTLRKGYSN